MRYELGVAQKPGKRSREGVWSWWKPFPLRPSDLSPLLLHRITGFLIISFCLIKNVRGAMIYGIAYVTIISWFRGSSQVTYFPHTEEGQARFDYFKKVGAASVVL
jgi:hypothetical protein